MARLLAAAVAACAATAAFAQSSSASAAAQGARVLEVREMSLLRALVMVDEGSTDMQQRLVGALVNRNFRVFEAPQFVSAGINTQDMKAAGEAQGAEIVIHASVTDEVADQTSGSYRYSAIANVRVINRVNGQTLAISPDEETYGGRSANQERARRDARRKAAEAAVASVVERILASSDRMMVFEMAIANVFDEQYLLEKMESIQRIPGVFFVRRLEFVREKFQAKIEIIASPGIAQVWRAWVEKEMPQTPVNFPIYENDKIRHAFPNWFPPPGR
jgi:hypothetical protein